MTRPPGNATLNTLPFANQTNADDREASVAPPRLDAWGATVIKTIPTTSALKLRALPLRVTPGLMRTYSE